ncbi:hypothetical protein D3C86_1576400 [compost metagenome]
MLIPEALKRASILGPIPSTIFKSFSLIFLPKTFAAKPASKTMSAGAVAKDCTEALVFAAKSASSVAIFAFKFRVFALQASKSA